MSYQGSYTKINNFAGGYCGNIAPTALQTNQAADLDNIVIKVGGAGWRMRKGNTSVTSSTPINSGAFISATGFYWVGATLEYVTIISGNKFMYRGNNATSFTDGTGSLTIGNAYYDMFNFGTNLIGVGGQGTPFKWNTGVSATLLGGTPPNGTGGFTTNNRVFIYNTSANPSTIYWSILASAEDWSSTGSGSAVAGNFDDQGGIIAHAVLSRNLTLLFTQTSTFAMNTTTAPFPISPLYKATGCAGQQAVVTVGSSVYFINQRKRMVSTDGNVLTDNYPESADDLWEQVQASQLASIVGWRQFGPDYDWIVWSVSTTGTSNNLGIIWDLRNKCWLKCSTGFNATSAVTTRGATNTATMPRSAVYMGGATGFVYKQDQATNYVDASNAATVIASYWQSGWLNPKTLDEIVHINRIAVELTAYTTGSVTFSYGFNFVPSFRTIALSQIATSTEQYVFPSGNPTGQGDAFRYKISYISDGTSPINLNSVLLRGKTSGQRRFSPS